MMTIEQFRSPELSALYTERYITRVRALSCRAFRKPHCGGRNPARKSADAGAFVCLTGASPSLASATAQPEQEAACLEKLRAHVVCFFRTFNLSASGNPSQKRNTSMKKRNFTLLWLALSFLAAFALWTVLVRLVDVQPIGPEGSRIGFAAMNGAFHDLTGVHWTLYTITDWMGLLPIAIALGFAVLGLSQLIERKSLCRVDRSILILGGFYVVVLAAYLLFETVVINYRPVLVDGKLEASYPSSTTMLALCILPTAMLQLRGRIRSAAVRKTVLCLLAAVTAILVVGRLISGVHWLSDILGGVFLSAGLVLLYAFICPEDSPSNA